MAEPSALLTIAGLRARYGESAVLHGIDLEVRPGEVVGLVGRNGAGKTTTLRSVIGTLRTRTGSVVFSGRETIGMRPRQVARLGIGYVPEERGIFSTLTVAENLALPPRIGPGGMTEDTLFELFPNLRERRRSMGTKLSGGEQQMLAIARILRTGSRFLLLDEPTEGLAPVIVDQIGRTLRMLKAQAFSIVLVEQNIRFAARLADRFYVIDQGRVVDTVLRSEAVDADIARLQAYVGV